MPINYLAVVLIGLVLASPATASQTAASGTWQSVATKAPVTLNAVAYVDGKVIWAVGKDGFLARSDDGETWTPAEKLVDAELNDVHFRDSKHGCVVGNAGTVLLTSDGGKTWMNFSLDVTGVADRATPEKSRRLDLYGVSFIDRNNGWIVGDEGTVFSTDNGGKSWTEQRSGTKAQLFNVSASDKYFVFAVGTGGTLVRSVNGGRTWERQPIGVSKDLNDIQFTEKDRAVITGDDGTLLVTVDRGATWVRRDVPTNGRLLGISFADKKSGWVAGYGGTILVTVDGGQTWTAETSGVSANLFALSAHKSARAVLVGADGIVLRRTGKK